MGQSCAGVAAWVTMQSAEGKSGASGWADDARLRRRLRRWA